MFIVIEIQENNGTVGNIVTAHETQEAAEAKFHTILAAAAVSAVPKHSAVLLSDEGFPLRNECYKHAAAPAAIVPPEEPAAEAGEGE